LFCSNYTVLYHRKGELRYDNLHRHVKKKHRDNLKTVKDKIRNLEKKRKTYEVRRKEWMKSFKT